jgi:hypothetical protein
LPVGRFISYAANFQPRREAPSTNQQPAFAGQMACEQKLGEHLAEPMSIFKKGLLEKCLHHSNKWHYDVKYINLSKFASYK